MRRKLVLFSTDRMRKAVERIPTRGSCPRPPRMSSVKPLACIPHQVGEMTSLRPRLKSFFGAARLGAWRDEAGQGGFDGKQRART